MLELVIGAGSVAIGLLFWARARWAVAKWDDGWRYGLVWGRLEALETEYKHKGRAWCDGVNAIGKYLEMDMLAKRRFMENLRRRAVEAQCIGELQVTPKEYVAILEDTQSRLPISSSHSLSDEPLVLLGCKVIIRDA